MGKGLFIMQFNRWYHVWFKFKGFCPVCGKYLTMSLGCVNYDCPLGQMSCDSSDWAKWKIYFITYWAKLKKKNNEQRRKRKAKNLDTSEKKHYIEDDNQGISE